MSPCSAGPRPRLPGSAAGGLRGAAGRLCPTRADGPGLSGRLLPRGARAAAPLFRPGWAGPPVPSQEGQCPGNRRLRSALGQRPLSRCPAAIAPSAQRLGEGGGGVCIPGGNPSILNRTPGPLEVQLLCPVLSTKSTWIGHNYPGHGWAFAAGYSCSSPQLPVAETVHLGMRG